MVQTSVSQNDRLDRQHAPMKFDHTETKRHQLLQTLLFLIFLSHVAGNPRSFTQLDEV
jgi:hypothetical protein